MTFDLRMAVFSGGRLTAAQQAQELLSCNDDTAAYGLRLTPQQAQALLDTRSAALRKTGRVELGGTILRRMILTFRDSPYLTAENYEATLHELVDAFYHFKTETEDRVGDEALLRYMKQAFDSSCHGSLELLTGTALPEMARRLCARAARPLSGEVSHD